MKALGIIYLTPHFSLYELCYSETAEKFSWDNLPDWDSLINLNHLAHRLEHVRNEICLPIIINSGFRTHKVNQYIGGAINSYHRYGRAVDIRCSDMDALREALNHYDWLEKIDYGTYIHVAL